MRRWAALGFGVLVALAACSDDSAPQAPVPMLAGAGEGGEPLLGPAGDAGSAARAGAGAVPSGGAGGAEPADGGAGGAAGQPHAATPAEVCADCAQIECQSRLQRCADSMECSAWLSCVVACNSSGCVGACDAQHAVAARVYTDVYGCLCDRCDDACSSTSACAKTQCVDDDPLPLTVTAPSSLAETGLYALEEGAGGAGGAGNELALPLAIAANVHGYTPQFPLWADGLAKERYVYVPKCQTIDTTDMDAWKFPVGTRFWKTFSLAGQAIETRLMHRFGPAAGDWLYAAYQWDKDAPTDATKAKWTDGAVIANANGTAHDIPGNGNCKQCHDGRSERVLGFGAFQLSQAAAGQDFNIANLSQLGWLSTPAAHGFEVPGTPVQQAALGYLHGNCGGCHFEGAFVPSGAPLEMRLSVKHRSYAETNTVLTTVDAPVESNLAGLAGKDRIEPSDPANSALLIRMQARGNKGLQMPPFNSNSTEQPDLEGGVAAVTAWVSSIPK